MDENLVYRGHPLRRVDNLVYYGSMADKYIIMMQVLDTEDVKDLKLAKIGKRRVGKARQARVHPAPAHRPQYPLA